MEVGIRKLRDHLSRYVDLVQSGTELTVTDHGRAVAQMTPLNGPWQFDRLVAGGLITRSAAKKQAISDEDRPNVDGLSDLVVAQRR